MRSLVITMLASMLAVGCGGVASQGGGEPGSTGPGSTLPVGTNTGAVVSVELRGNDALNFSDGSRIRIERFVVNFGGVSLLRDLADRQSSRVELEGRELPIIGGPGESVMDRFIIGKEKFEGGNFRGLRVELAPALLASDDSTDPTPITIAVHGRYLMPADSNPKTDQAKISPNPAPIEPTPGHSAQGLSSTYSIKFTFESKRSQNVLVGLGDDLSAGRSAVGGFPAPR